MTNISASATQQRFRRWHYWTTRTSAVSSLKFILEK